MDRTDEGRIIADRYKILRKIGDGGMGNIFLADDLQLSRQVAVKTIRPELKQNAEVRKRIDRECNLHATLGVHPNIVALYDKIEKDDNIFLIMEFVAGETLTSYLKHSQANSGGGNTLNFQGVVSITCQVLEALAHIHDHDILHRDIKPSNIILVKKRDGMLSAKLMDFGIAFQERADETLTRLTTLDTGGPGTPAYMAPERIDSVTFGDSGAPTDLYSVGIILYELLGGGPPFQGTMTEIFTGHLAKEPDMSRLPDTLPSKILDVLKKSLAKKQGQRFQNAREFITALQAAESSIPDRNSGVAGKRETNLDHTVLAADRHSKAFTDAVALSAAKKTGKKKWQGVALAIIALSGLAWGAWTYTRLPEEQVAVEHLEVNTLVDNGSENEEIPKNQHDSKDVESKGNALPSTDNLVENPKQPAVKVDPFTSPAPEQEPDVNPGPSPFPQPLSIGGSGDKNTALNAFEERRKEKVAALPRKKPQPTKKPKNPKPNDGWIVIGGGTKRVQ